MVAHGLRVAPVGICKSSPPVALGKRGINERLQTNQTNGVKGVTGTPSLEDASPRSGYRWHRKTRSSSTHPPSSSPLVSSCLFQYVGLAGVRTQIPGSGYSLPQGGQALPPQPPLPLQPLTTWLDGPRKNEKWTESRMS